MPCPFPPYAQLIVAATANVVLTITVLIWPWTGSKPRQLGNNRDAYRPLAGVWAKS